MALSSSTISKLADALAPDIIEYIEQDDRFYELMVEIIADAVSEILKTNDSDLTAELSMLIHQKIVLQLVGDSVS